MQGCASADIRSPRREFLSYVLGVPLAVRAILGAPHEFLHGNATANTLPPQGIRPPDST